MEKIIKGICVIMSLTVLGGVTVLANTVDNNLIRVGLVSKYKDKTQIELQNKMVMVGYNLDKNINDGNIIVGDNLNISIESGYYLETTEIFADYETAYNSLTTYGLNSYVNKVDKGMFSILAGPFLNESDAIAKGIGYTIINTPKFIRNNVVLKDGEKRLINFNNANRNMQISDLTGNMMLSDVDHYRGVIEVVTYETGLMTAVNVLDREKYLYSVVPSEMPQSWELEALKAQSVSARTYSYFTKPEHRELGYDVVDTIYSQVYLGVLNEHVNTTESVDGTKGEVVVYDNKLINSVFYSSSGGSTLNSEDVWTEVIPYLREVEDPHDKTGKVWELEYSKEDLKNIVEDKQLYIGDIIDITVDKRTSLGRVLQITFHGTKGNHTIEKDKIRGFFNSEFTKPLYSTNFIILKNGDVNVKEIVEDVTLEITILNKTSDVSKVAFNELVVETKDGLEMLENISELVVIGANGFTETYGNSKIIEEATIVITDGILASGKGNGHGVGLSQHGANGMAKENYTYEEILKHYYTDVEIKQYEEGM